ncbi:MAG: pirin family protein [Proteobacteria bacterium]|nr:pirin family protein [Pseudomonadota bacterium]
MTIRTIEQLVKAAPLAEGAGVTVHRTIGTPALRHLDPFLMLDHFGSDNPNEYIAGFPNHPHRGFVTLTYMLDGHMQHQDSMGNKGDLRAGGIQWMKAASGVIHSEMPQQTDGLMRGFQLWINLPAAQKMSDPGYQEFSAAAIPTTDFDGGSVRVISGTYADIHGPIEDPNTDVRYLDVSLSAGKTFRYELPAGMTAFVYAFQGRGEINGDPVPTHALAKLSAGSEVEITAEDDLRLILLAGKPIDEPIVQYGPFVMTSREEIEQAFADYRGGNLVRKRAAWISD